MSRRLEEPVSPETIEVFVSCRLHQEAQNSELAAAEQAMSPLRLAVPQLRRFCEETNLRLADFQTGLIEIPQFRRVHRCDGLREVFRTLALDRLASVRVRESLRVLGRG